MLLQVSKVKVFKALGRLMVMVSTLRCCSTDRDEDDDEDGTSAAAVAADEDCGLEIILDLVASAAAMTTP